MMKGYNSKVCLTINTDASFSLEQKVGGYAFYIKCDDFLIKKGGILKDVNNSLEAELMAIGNAIAILLPREISRFKWVIINTDCIPAIHRIKNPKSELDKKVHKLWQSLITKVASKRNKIRHVKAHTYIDSPKKYVNDWCDREAKKFCRVAIKNKNGLFTSF